MKNSIHFADAAAVAAGQAYSAAVAAADKATAFDVDSAVCSAAVAAAIAAGKAYAAAITAAESIADRLIG